MNVLFNEILTNVSSEITVVSALITILAAVLMGLAIAFTYYLTQDEAMFQRSFAVTLMMLPVIMSVIILFIGSNIARAFSMAGTLSIIRFRSAPGDPKDIGFIFFDIAAGLSCGVGLYGYGALFVIILCAGLLITEKLNLFEKKTVQKTLKITVPEDLNYEGAFVEILKRYSRSYSLYRIKTTDLGSLFELCYHLTMDPGQNEHDLLNELRVRNGNLNISLSVRQIPKK